MPKKSRLPSDKQLCPIWQSRRKEVPYSTFRTPFITIQWPGKVQR